MRECTGRAQAKHAQVRACVHVAILLSATLPQLAHKLQAVGFAQVVAERVLGLVNAHVCISRLCQD